MKIITVTFEDGTPSIQEAGGFKLGRIYRLKGDHYHRGKLIQLDWISVNKNIILNGVAHRAASGNLVNATQRTAVIFTVANLELAGAELARKRVRDTAAKLLKLGKKEQALKLLKTLKDA